MNKSELTTALTNELKEVSEAYIVKCGEWGAAQAIRNKKRLAIYFGPRESHPETWYIKTEASKFPRLTSEYYREQKWAHRVSKSELEPETMRERAIQDAKLHVEQVIAKIIERIENKGLTMDRVSVKSARIGVNLEATISDGQKSVRAWTIIAEGPIVRPHYRYLVK